MDTMQIVCGIFILALAIGAFVISYFQFKEKGYLFNNAYIWASQEERKRMNENKESKRPYYRQSGFVFMFIGISFLMLAIYVAADYWIWMDVAFWIAIIITVVYAVVSTVKMQRHH